MFSPTLIGLGDTKRNKGREKTPAEKHTVPSQVWTLTLVSLALRKRRQENHLDLRPKNRKMGKVSQGWCDVETNLSRVGDRSPLVRRLTHLKQCLPHCRKD